MLKRIAVQGIPGSYSDSAAETLFGLEGERLAFDSFPETLAAVADEVAGLGVVPTHNSIIGKIGDVDDLISGYGLRKVRVAALEIRHVLVGPPGSAIDSVRRVSSHPAALRQCSGFLAENPELLVVEDADTASAVRRVVEAGDTSAAAIGSRKAAEIYGGTVLLDRIADRTTNFTTFCLVKK